MAKSSAWLWFSLVLGCTPIEAPIEPDDRPVIPILIQEGSEATIPAPAKSPRAEGSLAVEVIPQFDRVMVGETGRLGVLVRLGGQDDQEHVRPPLHLSIVLDRSGSMTGDKILSVKQAALDTLRQLKPEDRVSLVTYASDVVVHGTLVEPGSPAADRLRADLLGMTASGGTALGPGLRGGIDGLISTPRGPDVLAHVLLLSDGLANEGPSEPVLLGSWASDAFQRGVGVSTLGVGADYAEDLMTRLADAGGGRYHFIERSDDVPRILADEFAGLTKTVARGVELNVATSTTTSIEVIHGYPVAVVGPVTQARIGSVAAGQRRDVLVELTVQASAPGPFELGTFVVNYVDATADGVARSITVAPRIEATLDRAAIAAAEHSEVTVRLAELQVASQLQQAMQAVEAGAYSDAESILDRASVTVQQQAAATPSPVLDNALGDLKQARGQIETAKSSAHEQKLYLKRNKSQAYRSFKK